MRHDYKERKLLRAQFNFSYVMHKVPKNCTKNVLRNIIIINSVILIKFVYDVSVIRNVALYYIQIDSTLKAI